MRTYYIVQRGFHYYNRTGTRKKNPIKSSENTWRLPSDYKEQIDLATNNGDIFLSYDGGVVDHHLSTAVASFSCWFARFQGKSKIGYLRETIVGNLYLHLYRLCRIVRIGRERSDVNACIHTGASRGDWSETDFSSKISSFDFVLVIFYSVVEFGFSRRNECHVATFQQRINN